MPWAVTADVSYVGQHGFNLLQNVDINAVDFGVAYGSTAQDTTVAASATPGGSAPACRPAPRRGPPRGPPVRRLAARRCRSICCVPSKDSALFSRTGASAGTPT